MGAKALAAATKARTMERRRARCMADLIFRRCLCMSLCKENILAGKNFFSELVSHGTDSSEVQI